MPDPDIALLLQKPGELKKALLGMVGKTEGVGPIKASLLPGGQSTHYDLCRLLCINVLSAVCCVVACSWQSSLGASFVMHFTKLEVVVAWS